MSKDARIRFVNFCAEMLQKYWDNKEDQGKDDSVENMEKLDKEVAIK